MRHSLSVAALLALALVARDVAPAHAQAPAPPPVCEKFVPLGGWNEGVVATWIGEQKAHGRGAITMAGTANGWLVVCAY